MEIIPLGHGDAAREGVRESGIRKLRLFVAQRWMDVFHLKDVLPEADFERVQTGVSASVAQLIELHGEDIPFAPDMKQIIPTTLVERVPIADVVPSEKASCCSSSSSRFNLPHEWRWIEMNEGVWTVLVVPRPTCNHLLFVSMESVLMGRCERACFVNLLF